MGSMKKGLYHVSLGDDPQNTSIVANDRQMVVSRFQHQMDDPGDWGSA